MGEQKGAEGEGEREEGSRRERTREQIEQIVISGRVKRRGMSQRNDPRRRLFRDYIYNPRTVVLHYSYADQSPTALISR
jgi:hypothetical protein